METQIRDQCFKAVDIHIICRSGKQRSILLVWTAQNALQPAPELLVTVQDRTSFAQFHDIAQLPLPTTAQIPDCFTRHRL